MSALPSGDLELKAARERERLHSSVQELRWCVRDNLDVTKHTRENLGLVSTLAALVGLGAGYAVAGVLVPRRKA
jgi:hypothetical protein